MLYQFQCQKEGTLFYYQHAGNRSTVHAIVHCCPLCQSVRVKAIRAFPDLLENGPPLLDQPENKREYKGEIEVYCHRIKYNFWWDHRHLTTDTPGLREKLDTDAEERAKLSIEQGVVCGEINTDFRDKDIRGYWEIDKT